LETVLCGSQRFTTRQAIHRYIYACTANDPSGSAGVDKGHPRKKPKTRLKPAATAC
jgi:hypothetical protein